MKDINKIIDSLSPVKQTIMLYKRDLIEVLSTQLVRMSMVTTSALIRECLALSDLKRENMLNQLINYGRI